jgi:hypothetical protein
MFTQLYDSYQNGHPSIASPFFLIFGTLSGGTALSPHRNRHLPPRHRPRTAEPPGVRCSCREARPGRRVRGGQFLARRCRRAHVSAVPRHATLTQWAAQRRRPRNPLRRVRPGAALLPPRTGQHTMAPMPHERNSRRRHPPRTACEPSYPANAAPSTAHPGRRPRRGRRSGQPAPHREHSALLGLATCGLGPSDILAGGGGRRSRLASHGEVRTPPQHGRLGGSEGADRAPRPHRPNRFSVGRRPPSRMQKA